MSSAERSHDTKPRRTHAAPSIQTCLHGSAGVLGRASTAQVKALTPLTADVSLEFLSLGGSARSADTTASLLAIPRDFPSSRALTGNDVSEPGWEVRQEQPGRR